ncbi:MAG: hypothetical protein QF685_08835, partial [Verrucomicrobiota bacterium]|nr:hypothetical protein [Verrucomicrobiota bacterium]
LLRLHGLERGDSHPGIHRRIAVLLPIQSIRDGVVRQMARLTLDLGKSLWQNASTHAAAL